MLRLPVIPPCIRTNVRILCGSCNRTFRSQTRFEKHKTNKLKGKPVCFQKRNRGKCNGLILQSYKHECFKQYCAFCLQNREAGHYCYMCPLANELTKAITCYLYFMTLKRHKTLLTESSTVHIHNLVCLQHFCKVCEKEPDIYVDCVRCGRRRHAFWDDPMGDLLTYLCKERSWCKKVIAIAHNAKGFDAHFILGKSHSSKMDSKINSE